MVIGAVVRWLSRLLHPVAPIGRDAMAQSLPHRGGLQIHEGPRPVGVCGECGHAVMLFPRARLACCPDGCTTITQGELEGGLAEKTEENP